MKFGPEARGFLLAGGKSKFFEPENRLLKKSPRAACEA
jgi:hypothetical protein